MNISTTSENYTRVSLEEKTELVSVTTGFMVTTHTSYAGLLTVHNTYNNEWHVLVDSLLIGLTRYLDTKKWNDHYWTQHDLLNSYWSLLLRKSAHPNLFWMKAIISAMTNKNEQKAEAPVFSSAVTHHHIYQYAWTANR